MSAGEVGRRPPVVVLLGGPSAEHDVSIVSGTAIADALAGGGWETTQILIDLAGAWWWLPADHRRAGRPQSAYDDPVALGAVGPFDAGAAIDRLAAATRHPVVFIALHGPFGEDGTVQALLEAAGLPYTGAGVAASALGMDKALFKRLVRGLGMPVLDWLEVTAEQWASERDVVLSTLEGFASSPGPAGSPDPKLIVKPARLGSSLGMTLAHTAGERAAALDLAFRYDTLTLIERYLPAPRELEVGVMGNDPAALETYGPGEVFPGREFYDYDAKYAPGLSRTVPAAEVPLSLATRLRELAAAAYAAIGAEGFARVDFLVRGDDAYVSEINTIPGFTPISLFPAMAAAGGLDFLAVAERIVGLALERHARRRGRVLTPRDLPR